MKHKGQKIKEKIWNYKNKNEKMSKLSSVICNLTFINTYELNMHPKWKKKNVKQKNVFQPIHFEIFLI